MEEPLFDLSKIKLPTYFFILYILLIPFESIMATRIFVMVSYATISALITSLFVLIYIVSRPNLLKLTKTAFPWVAFFLWSALSIVWSIDSGRSIYDFIYISKHVSFLILISSYPFDYSEKRIIRHAIILSGILLASTVFFTTFQIKGITTLVRATIANGYYKADPNHIASTLLLPMSFLIVDFVENKKFSILNFFAAIILFATIVYTGSRGSFIALAVMVIYFIVVYSKQKHPKKVILSLVFTLSIISLVISLSNPDLFSRFAKISTLDRYSAHRTEIWRKSFQFIREKPLAGYGFGTFKILPGMEIKYKTAHNNFIQAFAEGGGVGFLLMITAYIPILALRPKNQFDRAAKTGVIGIAITSLFLYTLNYDYFWLSIIIAEIANRTSPSTQIQNHKNSNEISSSPKLKQITDIS